MMYTLIYFKACKLFSKLFDCCDHVNKFGDCLKSNEILLISVLFIQKKDHIAQYTVNTVM